MSFISSKNVNPLKLCRQKIDQVEQLFFVSIKRVTLYVFEKLCPNFKVCGSGCYYNIVTCRPTINASFIFSMLTSNNKGMNCEINEAYAIGI